MIRIAIYGSAAGGGAGQIIEAMQHGKEMQAVFILDRDEAAAGKSIFNVPVIGSTEELAGRWMKKEFDRAVIAVGGDLEERKRIFDLIKVLQIPLANVFGLNVSFGLNVNIGEGNVILNNSYIGNNVTLGNNNYMLNQCAVQHDTVIGDHNYFALNVSIGAKVQIGSGNRFGIKSIAETRAVIGDKNSYGSGTIIKHKL